MKKLLAVFLAVGFLALGAHAQTPAPVVPDLLETGAPFAVSGSFSASSGISTNNGLQATMERRISKHVDVRLDQFALSSPANTMLSFVGVQAKYSLAHIVKPSAQFNTRPILMSVHAGPGALKSPDGHVTGAVGAGVSFDYVIPNMAGGRMFVRVLDYTYAYSHGLANNHQSLGNWNSVAAGFGVTF